MGFPWERIEFLLRASIIKNRHFWRNGGYDCMELDILIKMTYALAIGILIGLERSIDLYHFQEKSGKKSGKKKNTKDDPIGMRTYSILSLLGFTSSLLGKAFYLASGIILAGALALLLVFYIRFHKKEAGVTTETSAVLTIALGALTCYHPHTAGVLGVLLAVILASKRVTRKFILQIRRVEMTDTLKFLVIIFIILPILPNKTLDPYEVFNPYKMIFLVILISGISFVGYFLTKFLGARIGLSLTGLLGGLTSSTAVTVAMANQVKTQPNLLYEGVFATLIANATMFVRILVIVWVLDPRLVGSIIYGFGIMAVVIVVAGVYLWIKAGKNPDKEDAEALVLKNPFSLGPAVKFAIIFVGVLFAARIAKIYLGDQGIYLASLVSGLVDVDPITLSIAEQTRNSQLAYNVGGIGITIAVVSNALVKSAIAAYSGGGRFGLFVGAVLLSSTGIGLVSLLLM